MVGQVDELPEPVVHARKMYSAAQAAVSHRPRVGYSRRDIGSAVRERAGMRRDARMRRDALIAAAADSFADRGYSVPLEEVAARAGVGRGTLYRNFRDREALALAIFAREIDRIDAIVTDAGERPFREVMADLALTGTRGTALFARIATELVADTADRAALEAMGQRLAATLEPLASRARTDGDLRTGVDGATLGLALRMVGGLFYDPHDEVASRRRLDEALDIVLGGIGPVGA
jgi:AcrR family transcriptional regulator